MNPPWLKFLPAFIRSRLEGRDYLQNVIGNTSWQFADHGLRLVLGLIVGVWLARYLGPEQFGLFSYALAFAALATAVTGLGLDDIIVREVVSHPEERHQILGTTFVLRLVCGSISLLVALMVIWQLRPDDATSIGLVGIVTAGTLFQAFYVIEFWFHSQVQAKYVVMARGGAFVVCALLKIALILVGASLLAFAWATLLEVALGAVLLVAAYLRTGNPIRLWQGRLRLAKRLLRDSWPLMLAGMVILVYLRVDQIMLGEMADHEEVGIYSVAVRLAEVWYFVPVAIYWSVYPAIIDAKARSEELFFSRLQQFYNLMALCSYAIILPVALAAQWLVPLLFGGAYERAGLMLAVLIWSNLFTSLEMARSAYLTVMNWTRLYLLTVCLGCALNILLNLWLIPLYGGMGAVVASIAAYWFAAHGSCYLFRALRPTGHMLGRAIICPKIW